MTNLALHEYPLIANGTESITNPDYNVLAVHMVHNDSLKSFHNKNAIVSSTYTTPSPEQDSVTIVPPTIPNDTCIRVPELGRYSVAQRPFQSEFSMRLGVIPVTNAVFVAEKEPVVLKFDLRYTQDSGGTLRYEYKLDTSYWVSMSIYIITTQ